MSQFTHKRVNRRSVLKGAAATGLGLGVASSVYLPTAFAAQEKRQVLAWVTHGEPDLTTLHNIVDAFNEQSETTEVTLEQVQGSETDSAKLITAVRGGTGPDAYMLDRFVVAERAASGLLQDLTDPLTNAGFDPDLTATYLPFAAEEASWQGTPYALPFDTDTRGLFVNLDMIEEIGEDPAKFTLEADPLTWDELKEIMAKLNVEDGGNFTRFGFVPWHEQGHAYTYGFSFGATFVDRAACAVTPDEPAMAAAMDWIKAYSDEFGAAKMQAAVFNPEGSPPTENVFLTNRIGAMITGDWMIATIAKYKPELNYGIAKLPVPEAGMQSTTWAGGWSWVIPYGAREVDGAGEFLAYMSGEPGQRVYTKDTAHLPTVAALMGDPDIFDEVHAKYAEVLLPLSTNRPPLPVGGKYWDELQAAFQAIYLGTSEVGPALESARKNTQDVLDQYCPIE
ncbi:MAG: ABC transporter substrate-binding protein [Thermomicrobiales bacterium]|nr:ABC transporter substrate-binding protein [Thermomicrobiales bacterium]